MSEVAQDPMEIWSKVLETFNPQRPAPPEIRAPRESYNPLTEEIVPLLCQRLPHQKYILAGGIGSGKSTELLATADKVTPHKAVIFVDLLEHFTSRIGARSALNHLAVRRAHRPARHRDLAGGGHRARRHTGAAPSSPRSGDL